MTSSFYIHHFKKLPKKITNLILFLTRYDNCTNKNCDKKLISNDIEHFFEYCSLCRTKQLKCKCEETTCELCYTHYCLQCKITYEHKSYMQEFICLIDTCHFCFKSICSSCFGMPSEKNIFTTYNLDGYTINLVDYEPICVLCAKKHNIKLITYNINCFPEEIIEKTSNHHYF